MNLRLIADLAVARLGLPMPMAKLATIQAIALALEGDMAITFAEALADWIATRELESECLEALCPLLAAVPRQEATALIRRAIKRPSIASDGLLSLVTGSPTLVAAWTGCHSNPATRFVVLDEEESLLRAGTFIPPLFTHQLEKLERQSSRPFIRQWAFEYRVLAARYGIHSDGHLDYFLGSDRENVGQFVARRSHLARSAFLRTLACAVEHWHMPLGVASGFAETAYPAEPIFLRIRPQNAPEWARGVQRRASIEAADAPTFAKTVIDSIETELNGRIMHCSLAVVDEPRCHVEFEVFAIAGASATLDEAQVLRFYDHLLGKITPTRDSLRAFVSPDFDSEVREALGFVPLLLPLVGYSIGYLQADIVGRVPYVPTASIGLPHLELVPMPDGAVFRSEGCDVGSWAWWRWNWKPTHQRDQPAPTACCSSLTHRAARRLIEHFGGRIEHVWRISTWTRETDYGEWTETKETGRHVT